jgi:hypothetical protein
MDDDDMKEAAEALGRALEFPFRCMSQIAKPGFRFNWRQRWRIRFMYWIGCVKTAQKWILN